MKFEKEIGGKWNISLTNMKEIKRAIKDGIPITVGRIPVRAIRRAKVEYIYEKPDMQEQYGERMNGWLVDLGTDGIAGHGYDEEVHWYFCPANTVFNDCLMFQCPANLREGDWQGDGVDVISLGKEVIVIEDWEPPTSCGCILPKAENKEEVYQKLENGEVKIR